MIPIPTMIYLALYSRGRLRSILRTTSRRSRTALICLSRLRTIGFQAVAKRLGLDMNAAWRRLHGAINAGLVKNIETRRYQPGSYRTLDAPYDLAEVMPTVDALTDKWCDDA
jgi:hypothetical protein